MNDACKDACDLASWPARERIRALKRIIPRRKVEGVLQDCGLADRGGRRVPVWFAVWFVVGWGCLAATCIGRCFVGFRRIAAAERRAVRRFAKRGGG